MMPDPPKWLKDAFALKAWENAYYATVAEVAWCPIFGLAMGVLASMAATHCRVIMAARAAGAVLPPEDLREQAEMRLVIRESMADYYVIPRRAVHLGVIRADGIDADIAKFCGVALPAVH
jgi:hypothetical protein